MVFYHRCIPLSVNLREEAASVPKGRWETRFKHLVSCLSKGLQGDDNSGLEEAWDYVYDNLWEHRWGGNTFPFCPQKQQIAILATRTHWFKRLKKHNKNLLHRLLSTRKGALQLKEILHTSDGVISCLMMSYPEIFLSDTSRGAYTVADRITNSIISNGLQDYANLVTMLKGFRKRLRKCAFTGVKATLTKPEQRTMAWAQLVVNEFNRRVGVNSKANMFRACVFTQSRAAGLGNNKMATKAIDEFIAEVTTPKVFQPDKDLLEAIEFILDQVVSNAAGNPQFRISISTSACTENSKQKEGKFGYLKKVDDLPVIPKFSVTNPGGQLGNWAFRKAIEMVKASDDSIFKTNVCAIRENSKIRVVQSGSFYKDALLQPFSHMTIQAIKNQRSLKNGLSSGRLGWNFISRIDHLDPIDGHVLFEKHKRVVSIDWRKATDIPTFKSAYHTTGRLLEKMRLPRDILETVKCIWPGPKDIYINGKFHAVQVNGIPMGDPLTKTNLSLAHPICEAYASKKEPGVKVVHDGNGDDTAIILGSDDVQKIMRWVEYFNTAAAMLGYDLSQDDFFVTSSWGTYCEEVFHIPLDRFNTVRTASKLKDNRLLPYLDHPKMRLVIDTKKDRRDYSSVKDGKYTLLGKDTEYAEQGVEGHLFQVASVLQDICLGLRYERRPVYLPRQIFSVGKMPAFWNTESWANAIYSQIPKVSNVTVTALRELLDEIPKNLTNMRSVKSMERHFDSEAVTEVFQIPDDDPIKNFIIVPRDLAHKIPPGVLDRLVSSKHLTTSSEVEALYLYMKRIETLSQEIVGTDLMEMVFSRCTEMKNYTFEETLRVCKDFKEQFYKKRWAIKPLLDVDYYFTEDIDEFRNSDPRNVDIPEFDYIQRFGKRLPPDTPKRRAEEELYNWFVEWRSAILEDEFYELPPIQLLEDDPYILQQIARSDEEVIIIVSDDRKLARLASNKFLEKMICRISVKHWLLMDANERPILDAIKKDLKADALILVDEGSLDAFLWRTDIDTVAYPAWDERIDMKPPRQQEDIWNVYLPPVTTSNVYDFVEIVDYRRAVRVHGRRGREV
jgi:hypothetical protein